MRASIWFGTIAITGFGIWHFMDAAGPSVSQVEPLLRSYLESARGCSGSLDVKQLDNIAVGKFVGSMGGWPVYANHVEVCRAHDPAAAAYQNAATTTYDGSPDADRKLAAAFVRHNEAGGFEIYEPAIFKAGH
jgi:hypothetical protein